MAYSNFYKLIMNSLYGKFGQNVFEKIMFLNEEQMLYMVAMQKQGYVYKRAKGVTIDPKIKKVYAKGGYEKADDVEIEIEKGQAKIKMMEFYNHSSDLYKLVLNDSGSPGIGRCVHVASFIAGMARQKLIDGLMANTENGRKLNVYYCDTDSMVVMKKDNKLPSEMMGDNLGQWKQESEIKWGDFLAPKFYRFLGWNKKAKAFKLKNKCKGVRPRDIKPEIYEEVLKKGKTTVKATGIFQRLYQGVRIREEVDKVLNTQTGLRRQWFADGTSKPPYMVGVFQPVEPNDPPLWRPEDDEVTAEMDRKIIEEFLEEEEKPEFVISDSDLNDCIYEGENNCNDFMLTEPEF